MMSKSAYQMAQTAIAHLKAAVYEILERAKTPGLRNSDIGRALGIYAGHIEHEGHISRTLLEMMKAEGVVEQDDTSKRWTLKIYGPDRDSDSQK
jgi:hypothetical protein